MHQGINLLVELYPRCFCRTNRRPLKVGIYEQIISQHPEMSKPQIKRLLDAVRDAQLDGTITTREQAHELLRRLIIEEGKTPR